MSLSKNASAKEKRPLKIGFVFDDTLDNPDGVQQYITTLGEWFCGQGDEVRYLVGETKKAGERTDIYALARNFSVRFNKNRLSLPLPANRERIAEVLAHEKFDVLHVQLPCSPLMSGRVVRAANSGIAIIGTFHIVGHHWLVNHGAKLLGLWQRNMMSHFDCLTSVSSAAADFAARHLGQPGTVVLPNVIDAARYAKARPNPKLASDKVTIVFLGRLVERKGCQYFIEAIRRIRDRGGAENLRVLIGGKGPLAAKLKQRVRAYDLAHIISFVGFIAEEDKADFLAAADLAVFPSTGGESFGIVLLEAMAAGSGVVMGGDNEGYRTVLGGEANHVLCDPRHTQVFADKIQLLLTNVALRARLHAWQQREVQQYDVAVVGPKLRQLYEKCSLLKAQG